MRLLLSLAAIGLIAATLSACESTQDKAAKIQKINAAKEKIAALPLTVKRVDPRIKVVGTVLLHNKNAGAVVVTMRNTSNTAIADIPIAVNLYSGSKQTATNTTPGNDHWLNHIPLVRAGQTVDWVEDQFDPEPIAKRATVRVGVGKSEKSPLPDATIAGTKFFADPVSGTSLTGKVTNNSTVLQVRPVVYSVGRRGGQVVAAGRGVLEKLLPKGGKPSGFSLFYVGADPKGLQLTSFVPPIPPSVK